MPCRTLLFASRNQRGKEVAVEGWLGAEVSTLPKAGLLIRLQERLPREAAVSLTLSCPLR